jgi:hypothetical protein
MRSKRYAQFLATAIFQIDQAARATGSYAVLKRLNRVRVELAELLRWTGWEFSDRPPKIRKQPL